MHDENNLFNSIANVINHHASLSCITGVKNYPMSGGRLITYQGLQKYCYMGSPYAVQFLIKSVIHKSFRQAVLRRAFIEALENDTLARQRVRWQKWFPNAIHWGFCSKFSCEIRNQKTFVQWNYNFRHEIHTILWHSDVILRLSALRVNFCRGNINMYLHFMSFLHTNMPKIIEILPSIRAGLTYFT